VSAGYIPGSQGLVIISHMRDEKWVPTIFLFHMFLWLLHIQ